MSKIKVIVGVCREDNPADVDEAYGAGTYALLFPEDECPDCGETISNEHSCNFEPTGARVGDGRG